jgi:molybdopterin converting factor small subunit
MAPPGYDAAVVRIELFGVPRLRAERDAFTVEADTLGGALVALERACPALTPSVVHAGHLGSAYLIALNGRQFTSDPATALSDGDVLVLVAAQAGG